MEKIEDQENRLSSWKLSQKNKEFAQVIAEDNN